MLKLGIIGLPNVGKSTLFNALTQTHAPAENYPFTTIEPNIGTVMMPDNRLDQAAALLSPAKVVPAHLEFVDIAGLVKGAHKGEGLGNRFLSHIRDVQAIVHVVRCFSSRDVAHVSAEINPLDDIESIHTELLLADLDILENHLVKMGKKREEEAKKRVERLSPLLDILKDGQPLRTFEMDEELRQWTAAIGLLTQRPELFVINLDDQQDEKQAQRAEQVRAYAQEQGLESVEVYVRLENDLQELEPDEQALFMEELGIEEPTTFRLIQAGFRLLNLITFYTTENNILQAWNLQQGQTAPQAAGQIHSDMQQGFISADVISFDDLDRCRSMTEARKHGLLRQEGKQYEVHDGDILRFHFA